VRGATFAGAAEGVDAGFGVDEGDVVVIGKKQSRPKAARTLSPKIEGGSVIEYSATRVVHAHEYQSFNTRMDNLSTLD
jgi:hypothetical protein